MPRNLNLEKQIDAYIKGQLSEEEAQELWEELLMHPEYIDLLNTELGVQSIVTESDTEQPPAEDERHSLIHTLQNSWKWVGAAAVVALLVVAINFFSMDSTQTLKELSINSINLSENLSSAPVLRSKGGQVTPEDSLLNLGFKAAVDGDLAKAVSLYDKIIQGYPELPAAVQAYLNKGIIQFNKTQFDGAILSFKAVTEKAGEESFAREKGFWYLGNAYINTDSLEEAHSAIFQAYSMDGIYRTSARDILKKLDKKLGNPQQEYDR